MLAAHEELLTEHASPAALRRLEDGSAYRIVKVFHEGRALVERLAAGSFIVGLARPASVS
ncbi:hypothetical protein ACIBUY_33535 [Streptomyces sp. NPDC050085]|uniref:hypothetical protein n=1 Tax=Streptomyces sp. NPDC050085 TaxID=3365600 RepID=UPI0037B8929C